jgi:pyrroloquinoline quinone biosynthesis protein B
MDKQMNRDHQQLFIVILGIMQDAGLPHIGCLCRNCQKAFNSPEFVQFSASIGIVDNRLQPPLVWLVDATPDIKYQINMLSAYLGRRPTHPKRLRQPAGIFLTHGHMGHTSGLLQLGPEGMNVSQLPVYGKNSLIQQIRSAKLWRPLVNNLNLIPLVPSKAIKLSKDFEITPFEVNHRDETLTGTLCYLLSGNGKRYLYIPDIDHWQGFSNTMQVIGDVDVAIVDATFFRSDEVPNQAFVSHPLVSETIEFWQAYDTEIILTHINHSNPILNEHSDARQSIKSKRISVAKTGDILAF